jgi:hypothetical protein
MSNYSAVTALSASAHLALRSPSLNGSLRAPTTSALLNVVGADGAHIPASPYNLNRLGSASSMNPGASIGGTGADAVMAALEAGGVFDFNLDAGNNSIFLPTRHGADDDESAERAAEVNFTEIEEVRRRR